MLLWKESLNSDIKQFHQCEQNEQSTLTLTHWTHKKKGPWHMALEIQVLTWDRHVCLFCVCFVHVYLILLKLLIKICLKLFIKIFYCINPHQHCIIQIVQERVTIINTTKQRQIIKILVIIDEYMYARHWIFFLPNPDSNKCRLFFNLQGNIRINKFL